MKYSSDGDPVFNLWQEKVIEKFIQNPPGEIALLSPVEMRAAIRVAKGCLEWPDQECPAQYLVLKHGIQKAFDESYSQFVVLGKSLIETKEKIGSYDALWNWLPKNASGIPIEDAKIAVQLAMTHGDDNLPP